jgi:hypothetical protein
MVDRTTPVTACVAGCTALVTPCVVDWTAVLSGCVVGCSAPAALCVVVASVSDTVWVVAWTAPRALWLAVPARLEPVDTTCDTVDPTLLNVLATGPTDPVSLEAAPVTVDTGEGVVDPSVVATGLDGLVLIAAGEPPPGAAGGEPVWPDGQVAGRGPVRESVPERVPREGDSRGAGLAGDPNGITRGAAGEAPALAAPWPGAAGTAGPENT